MLRGAAEVINIVSRLWLNYIAVVVLLLLLLGIGTIAIVIGPARSP